MRITPHPFFIVFLFGVMFMGACSPRVYPSVEIRDSVKVEYRDKLVHDTIRFAVPKIVERIMTKDTISVLTNDWASSEASVSGGILYHSLETIPRIVEVPVTYVVHDTLVVENKSHIETKVVEVKKSLTKWQKAQMRGFYALLSMLLVMVGAWIIKKRYL